MSNPRAARRPTAADRTPSLFTGKTDLEDPVRGRDGFVPGEPRRKPATIKPLKWDGGVTRWYVMDGPRGESYVVEKSGGAYIAHFFTRRLGTFASIIEAGDACDAHHRGQR